MVVRLNGQPAITAADFPPGFLLVGLIAASSALIFWLLPPNAGAEMADRVPPTAARVGSSGWADGIARDIEAAGLAGGRDGKIRRCCVIRSPSCWPLPLAALVPARRRRATGQADRDEQRCTGQAGVTPDVQAEACTALIDSGRFTRQNLAILHSNRGIAYGKAGDYDRAIADFDAALRINPNHVRAYLNRGNANFARRDFDRAIADFGQAIRLEPQKRRRSS